jgi:hypothetical protein
VTKKVKDEDKAAGPVLGTGASGDPTNPGARGPVVADRFEPAAVNAPETVEKEVSK